MPPVKTRQEKAEKRKNKNTGQTSQQDETVWTCKLCATAYSDDSCEVMECEYCEDHFCTGCLEMTHEEYKMLTKRKDLHWYCPECEAKALVSIRVDKDVARRCADYFSTIEKRLGDLENDVKGRATKGEVTQLESRLRTCLDTKADREEVKQLEHRIESLEDRKTTEADLTARNTETAHMGSSVEVSVEELRDRDFRKDKLVIFNIPESTDDDTDNRKLYDVSQVVELVKVEMGIDTNIDNPVRLGKRQSSSKYPRPLRVSVDDEQTKWKVLKSAKNLKTSGKEIYREVYIKRDMTRMERAADDRIRQQLKEKRREAEEAGQECKWTIRRGKLVDQTRHGAAGMN